MSHSFLPVKEQLDRIKSAVEPVEIISEEELALKLERSIAENKPLRIKQGFDASAPDLHIGHAVSIWKLRTFQDLGHRVIFLIGDFTGMVGDPSGKSKTRPRLTKEQVDINAKTYQEQVYKILDPKLTEVRFNSEWHASRNIYRFLELTSHFTVRRMLERDDFWKRFNDEQPISILEFLYPLIQAYDSVALEADVELGGTDQKFNLVLARQIQRAYGQKEQVVFLMPLMRGLDGNQKMSKSLGNYIGVIDEPDDMYGKVMSISDEMLAEYIHFALGARVLNGAELMGLVTTDPYKAKHTLAKQIVRLYHPDADCEKVCDNFMSRFRDHDMPTARDLIECGAVVKVEGDAEWLPKIIVLAGAAKSNGEALRLIKGGGVMIDGVKVVGEDRDV